jgi:predicted DNA-binding protein with PD1-like motif
MKAKLISDGQEKVYVLVFDKGDETMQGLLTFAKEHHLTAGHFTAIGAFSDVTLGYFDRDRKAYKKIPVAEQVEVLSLIGDIALNDGEPKVHAHVVVGRSDGTVRGGHLLEGHVWPTLEVTLEQSAKHLQRESDRETGLALIRL